MGKILNASQFIDVVEYLEEDNKQIVWKFQRARNEIKHGARLIVRPGQAAILVHRGQLADCFGPGHYVLKTKNLPILSTLLSIPFGFNSPIKSDVYFINTTQFFGMRWETSAPILKRDMDMGMVRISAKGAYAFQIVDPKLFISDVYGARKMDNTAAISEYMSSFVGEAVAQCIGEMQVSVLDLAMNFRNMSEVVSQYANEKAAKLGITIPEAVIEHISLPPEVEKMIDEQSGIGLASRNMGTFMQYQTARAMRDAAKQNGGLAGLGAGYVFGQQITQAAAGGMSDSPKERQLSEKLREMKRLVGEGVLTNAEFERMKQQLLSEMSGGEGAAPAPAPRQERPAAAPAQPVRQTPPPPAPAAPPRPVSQPAPTRPAPPPAPRYPAVQRRSGPANSPASAYAPGKHVTFGGLSWCVVKQTSATHALIVCDDTVATVPYHTAAGPVTWEQSALRAWLNDGFLKGQFNAQEQKAVMVNPLRPEQSAIWPVDPGRPTQDAVFCLGAREFTKNPPASVGQPFWLRSPGKTGMEVAVVTPQGRITSLPADSAGVAVRPAIWIELGAPCFGR